MNRFLGGALAAGLIMALPAQAQQIPTYNARQSGVWTFGLTGPVPADLRVGGAAVTSTNPVPVAIVSGGSGGGGGAANPYPGADYAKDTKQPTLVSGRVPVDGSAVTQPVSGAISVTNLPATQAVSGTIAATQSGAWTVALPSGTTIASTQSGAYTVTQGPAGASAWKVDGSGVTQPVSGTFWQTTQPVSLASVPSHPVTNTGTFSVQNTAAVVGGNALAVKTDGSASTQPISGTVAISGTVPVSGTFFQATQPVSAAALPLPSGGSTSALQSSTQGAVAGGAAAPASTLIGGIYNTTAPTLTSGQQAALQFDASGNLKIAAAGGSTSSGSITAAGTSGTQAQAIQGITNGVPLPVSGTFFQATQPISATALPLPSGAATAAKQPALGTAGTASADVLTVQGAAAMTPLKVDASATTQPVSAASLPLPSGAATSTLQTTGNSSLASLDSKTPSLVSGRQPVDGSGVTQPVSGTVKASSGVTPSDVSGTLTANAGAQILGADATRQFIAISNTGANSMLYRFSTNGPTSTIGHTLPAGATVIYDAKVPTSAITALSVSGTTYFITAGN